MKKIEPRSTKPDSIAEAPQRRQDKRGGKCSHRLSKTATRGEKEAPADRGACEEETSVQGSE